MRLSVDPTDYGYDPGCYGTKVYLAGEEVTNCITADDVEGLVVCYAHDAQGRIMIDPDKPDEAKRLTRRGPVRIEPGPDVRRGA